MHSAVLPLGIIAGGMADGIINLWDAYGIVSGKSEGVLLGQVKGHKGGVNALQFNPHPATSHLLASGASDAEVFVTDCSRPNAAQTGTPAPPEAGKHNGEVTT
jgi:hypothetical protein